MDSSISILHVPHRILTEETSFLFRRLLVDALQDEPRYLILDLSSVEHIDQSCLGVMMLASRMVPGRIRLMIVCSLGQVRDACEKTRIARLIPMYFSIEDARSAALGAGQEVG